MTEPDMLEAIRNRYKNAYVMEGKDSKELIICGNGCSIIAEFKDDDSARMAELAQTYGVVS